MRASAWSGLVADVGHDFNAGEPDVIDGGGVQMRAEHGAVGALAFGCRDGQGPETQGWGEAYVVLAEGVVAIAAPAVMGSDHADTHEVELDVVRAGEVVLASLREKCRGESSLREDL